MLHTHTIQSHGHIIVELITVVKTPTPTQRNTTVGFDMKMTFQTPPHPTHPPPTETFQALLDELES